MHPSFPPIDPPAGAHRVLLIDDEPGAIATLRALLAAHPSIVIAGEASTRPAARALLARTDYDLVFFDIQLRGGTAFELVLHVRPGARIVFVTAHDRFALRAFEFNALDYLLKPVAPVRLAGTLARLAALPPRETAPFPTAPSPLDDPIHIGTRCGAGLVPLHQISAILSGDNYTELRLTNGRRLLLRRSLAAWETTLPRDIFMRAHRQAIVNLTSVKHAHPLPDERGELHLTGWSDPLIASRRLWPSLRTRLAKIELQRSIDA